MRRRRPLPGASCGILLRGALPGRVFSEDGRELPEVVVHLLRDRSHLAMPAAALVGGRDQHEAFDQSRMLDRRAEGDTPAEREAHQHASGSLVQKARVGGLHPFDRAKPHLLRWG